MKQKRTSLSSPFLGKRKNYFSDTQYNSLVTALGKIDRDGEVLKITANNISASKLLGLIKQYYRVSRLEKEKKTDIKKKDTVVHITFEKGEGGKARWYAEDLARIQASGIIRSYSPTDPKVGYNEAGIAIPFDEVYNNATYKSNKSETGNDPLGGIDPLQKIGAPGNDQKDDGGGNSSSFDIGTVLIVGAVIVLVVILIRKKKK